MATAVPKKLVADVGGGFRVFDDGTVDRTWTGPPQFRFLRESVPPYDTPRDGVTVHDIPGDPTARVYLPEGDRSHLPVLLHFHGGGFCITHASWGLYHQFYSRLASFIPAVVVSPFLPLAPEHRLPAATDACYEALLWLRTLSRKSAPESAETAVDRLRSAADFSRVFLIGDSSGGNLVHAVAAKAGDADVAEKGFWSPLRLAGGIPIHPGFARSTRSRSELELSDAFLTLDMMDTFFAFALPEGSTKDHPMTCPMGEAAPPMEGLRLPPFLVGVAEKDLLRDRNIEYCEAMKKAGKDVEMVLSEGVGHAFYLNKIAVDSDPTTAQRCQGLMLAIKDFIDRH